MNTQLMCILYQAVGKCVKSSRDTEVRRYLGNSVHTLGWLFISVGGVSALSSPLLSLFQDFFNLSAPASHIIPPSEGPSVPTLESDMAVDIQFIV